MKVQTRRAIKILALMAVSACSNEHRLLTDALPRSPRFDIGLEGTNVDVCVSNDSPVGDYTFKVNDVEYAAGGSTVPAPGSAVVSAGSCFTLVSRLIPEDELNPTADPYTTITYTYSSSTVPGAVYVSTSCSVISGAPPSDPCGKTVVAHVNFVNGTTAFFTFVSSVQKIEDLRDLLANLDIPKAAQHELDDRLRDASKEAAKGHYKAACSQIDQFLKKLTVLSKKKIEDSDATTLRGDAENIQTLLGCN